MPSSSNSSGRLSYAGAINKRASLRQDPYVRTDGALGAAYGILGAPAGRMYGHLGGVYGRHLGHLGAANPEVNRLGAAYGQLGAEAGREHRTPRRTTRTPRRTTRTPRRTTRTPRARLTLK